MTGWSTGAELVDVIEALSGRSMPNREKLVNPTLAAKSRLFQMNTVTEALNWSLHPDQKVKIELRPSSENLVDGEEKSVLGMTWQIMRSYLNVGNDDDRLSAEEALLRWVQRETAGYEGVNVKDFKGSWHDGLAFCALIHKYRPNLIGEWSDLKASNGVANIQKAQDGAFEFFRLERYIAAEDVPILDDKSMIIYVSEWYNGIVGHQKVFQAARRIGDVINFTEENDRLKEEYMRRARILKGKFDPAVQLLTDDSVDNTLEGARAKLHAFEHFKDQVKDSLVNEFLSLESFMNVLSTRLGAAKRPAFVPADGLSIAELRDQFKIVESAESARHAALVKEYNRQVTLERRSEQHAARAAKIGQRLTELEAEIEKVDLQVKNTSVANFQVNKVKANVEEIKKIKESAIQDLAAFGKTLLNDKYSKAAKIASSEAALSARAETLVKRAGSVLLNASAAYDRCVYQDKIRSLESQHATRERQLVDWAQNIRSRIAEVPSLDSITACNAALSNLQVLRGDRAEHTDNLEAFLAIGNNIKAAAIGDWKVEDETVAAVNQREANVQQYFAAVDSELASRQAEFEAALAECTKVDETQLAWAIAVTAVSQSFRDKISAIADTEFGFTLAEVKAFDLDAADAEAQAFAKASLAEFAAIPEAKSGANPYTDQSGAAVAALTKGLEAALAERRSNHAAALARLEKEDELCRVFAKVANPFVEWIASAKDKITNSVAPPSEQLEAVKAAQAEYKADERLGDAIDLWRPIEGVQSNPHSLHTGTSLTIQWQQYSTFLDTKERILDELLRTLALRGLSQDQWDLATRCFADFDKSNSGKLAPEALRSALFALGESRKKEEVEAIVKEFGSDGTVTLNQFMDFVVLALGGQNTREKIEEAFVLINQGHAARIEHMKDLLTEKDIAYILATAPKDPEGNVDLKGWIDQVYSR